MNDKPLICYIAESLVKEITMKINITEYIEATIDLCLDFTVGILTIDFTNDADSKTFNLSYREKKEKD